MPPEPVPSINANNAIPGANDDVRPPRGSTGTDPAVEPGLVTGTAARNVTGQGKMTHGAGYRVVNVISERAPQPKRHGAGDKRERCDTFGP